MSRKVDQFNKENFDFLLSAVYKVQHVHCWTVNLGIVGSEQEQIVLGIRILIDFQLSE